MERYSTITEAKKELRGTEFYMEVYQDGDADNSYDLIINKLDGSDGVMLERYEEDETAKLIKKLLRLEKTYGIEVNVIDDLDVDF